MIATRRYLATTLLAFGGLGFGAGAALAQPEGLQVGQPHPWQIGLQPAASPIKIGRAHV